MNWSSISAAGADEVLQQTNGSSATVCYENAVPPYLEDEIERRYGSLFSTLPHLRYTGKLTDTTNTYVRHIGGQLQTVLLFNVSGERVTVLNELVHLSGREIAAFVAFVFERYATVSVISFKAVCADLEGLHYPLQRYFCSEDIVIPALVSVDGYAERLKKSTRKSIRRHGNALLRAHPSATFAVLPAQAIDDNLVHKIVGFNKARMANKERVSAYTDEESRWIAAMAGVRGLAVTVTINERLCAGAVCCDIGGSFFLLVTAHDPTYDQFGLGMLCSYRTVCECIARGGKDVHLLWGRLPYKTDLGGAPRRFDEITVYRNRMAYLRRLDRAMLAAIFGLLHEVRLSLLDAAGQPGIRGRLADMVWRCARQGKHAVNVIRRSPR